MNKNELAIATILGARFFRGHHDATFPLLLPSRSRCSVNKTARLANPRSRLDGRQSQGGIIKSLLRKSRGVILSPRHGVLSPNTSDLMTRCVNQTLRLPPLARPNPLSFSILRISFHSRPSSLSLSPSRPSHSHDHPRRRRRRLVPRLVLFFILLLSLVAKVVEVSL